MPKDMGQGLDQGLELVQLFFWWGQGLSLEGVDMVVPAVIV